MIDLEIGDQIKINSWDLKGRGRVTAIHNGAVSVLVEGFDDPMLFFNHEIMRIKK